MLKYFLVENYLWLALVLTFVCLFSCTEPTSKFNEESFIDSSADRVKVYFDIPFDRIGTVKPKNAKEITKSNWSVGCEVLDRDYTNYESYKEYLPKLGIKKIRLQGGWAKTEKEKGVYDWKWLDDIIDDALKRGLKPWISVGYGNPIYEGGGGIDLGGGFPVSEEALAAWDTYIEALVERYQDRIDEWEMWNEPNRWGAEAIAENNIRTARIIKRIQPDAQIAGLTMAGHSSKLLDQYLKILKERGYIDLFKWVVYHGYIMNPDDIYDEINNLKKIVRKYSSDLLLRQGENGAPSGYCPGFALREYEWTEISQSKWDTRRMLGDLGRDIETSIFCIIDMYYRDWGENEGILNIKGLIQSDKTLEAIRPKIAFYSVQNVASIFDDQLERIQNFQFDLESSESVSIFGYKNRKTGKSLITIWMDDEIPDNHFDTKNVSISISDADFTDPVWVDIFSGRIYDIPKESWSVNNDVITFEEIPVYDSPVLLSDRSNIDFQ